MGWCQSSSLKIPSQTLPGVCLLSDSKSRVTMKIKHHTAPVPQSLPTGSQHFSPQTAAAHLAMLGSLACANLPAPLSATSTQFHSHVSAHRPVCMDSLGGRCWRGARHGGHRTNATLPRPLTGRLVLMSISVLDRGSEYSRCQGLWINYFLLLRKRRAVVFSSSHTHRQRDQRVHNAARSVSLPASLPLFLINLLNASFQSCSQ